MYIIIGIACMDDCMQASCTGGVNTCYYAAYITKSTIIKASYYNIAYNNHY